ncbi:MAG: DEAD/DEAH box helicase, partial [Pseudomonadales bacterium]|nr:DEAD/DEAH box helicase [Pseudomonadales bacterium]
MEKMINDALKKTIQQAYTQFLDSKGLKARLGQKVMIAEIAKTLGSIEADDEGVRSSEHHICVVEAGTGTGKTVAYALAAIPIAQALEKKVVIATATVSLQEQIVLKDLPDIIKSAGLDFSFVLAKGRSRYVCLSKLDQQLDGSEMTQTLALYPDEMPMMANASALELFNELATALAKGDWQGDRDSWARDIASEDWQLITTDHRQCTGRRCSYISQCSFYKARDKLQSADVIVANHDLVLADLSLGGGAILPEPEDTIYVFDEAHHLADKAIQHFASHTRVKGTQRWAAQAEKTVQALCETLKELDELCSLLVSAPQQLQAAQSALQEVYQLLEVIAVFPDISAQGFYQRHRRHRFANGVVPTALQQL